MVEIFWSVDIFDRE